MMTIQTDLKPRILLVDDIPFNIQTLAETLRGEYQISVATSGKEALTIANSMRPSLILLDIMMPEMDGYEVCSRLKGDPQTNGIPIIFVTALDDEKDQARGLDLGAVDYITKPFIKNIVKARVKNHLMLSQALIRLEDEIVAKRKLVEELQEALNKVKTLSGLIPICASCKQIRDDKGFWHQVEDYIHKNSEAEFTHGICPKCAKKYYPDYLGQKKIH